MRTKRTTSGLQSQRRHNLTLSPKLDTLLLGSCLETSTNSKTSTNC